ESSRAPCGGLPFPLCADRSRLLFAALGKQRLGLLVNPVADRHCDRRVGHGQANHGNTPSFHVQPCSSQDGARHFGTLVLGWHLLNHASAAFSPEFNQVMMSTLRKWYRSEFVQPVLVTLMLF